MPSLQLQLVISPSVVHVRDLKLFFLKAPKASLVLFIFSIALNIRSISVFVFFFKYDIIGRKGCLFERNFREEKFFDQIAQFPAKWISQQLIHPAKSNAICKLALIWKLHKTKKLSTPAWHFHGDSPQYCMYLHSFLEDDALLSTITSKLLTLSHFLSLFLWGAWVVQWWEHSPHTNMGGVQILVCGLSLLLIFFLALKGFFSGTLVFSLKTNTSKCQFNLNAQTLLKEFLRTSKYSMGKQITILFLIIFTIFDFLMSFLLCSQNCWIPPWLI